MSEPGFWNDQERAQKISTEHARVARRLEMYERLRGDYDDAVGLLELEPGLETEIAAAAVPLRQELERLQEAALFDGEYDAGDAVVTLQSGTGGTDAQDWTEMVLRMYERWASDRGFRVELLEASPGEEAGLKSATFTVSGGGSADAIPDGRVGVLVDAGDRTALVEAISGQLAAGKADISAVEPYRHEHFAEAARLLLARVMGRPCRMRDAA